MAESISIVMKMQEDISGKLKSIASTSKGCSKEFEDLQKKLKSLGAQYEGFSKESARLSAKAIETRKSMTEAAAAFKKTGSAADETNFKKLKAEYEGLTASAATYSQMAKDSVKAMRDIYQEGRKLGDSGGGSGEKGGFLSSFLSGDLANGLAHSGLIRDFGSSVSNLLGAGIESSVGQPMATMLGETLSGTISGAAAGAIAGLPGMAIGAAIGAVSGGLNAKTAMFEAEDDAFKAYYQGLYEDANAGTAEGIAAGSATAGQRELDAIAFNRLLGEGAGDQYLADLRDMAASTPMEYGDLTVMSRALATGFGDSPERMLELMQAIGDAGSAVGVTASDMTEMARAMSRMNSSGKATLEFLNIFQDRGVDVIGMLGEAMGKTQGEIYDMISKGKINGQDAASIIQSGMEGTYGGAMETMAQTFSGLTSTLQDAMTEVNAAYGAGYNPERSEGLEAEIAAYGGALGQALETLNGISGKNAAYGENLAEQYTREALSAVLVGWDTSVFDEENAAKLETMRHEYLDAWNRYGQGDMAAGREMENLKEEVEALATAAFASSEWSQKLHDAELDQIDATRQNTIGLEAATHALEISNAFSKGRGISAFVGDAVEMDGPATGADASGYVFNFATGQMEYYGNSDAFGLKYVPYDGYPAVLHQGERVLTAEEARRSRGGGGGTPVVITGNSFTVRQESDIQAVAEALADEIESRALVYGG